MNEINIHPSQILAAKLLSSERANIQLYQMSPVTFAVYDRVSDRVVLGFASSSLAECLLDIGHIKILEVCYRRHEDIASANPVAPKSLTLVCSDSRNIVLDSNDRVWIQESFSTLGQDQESLWTPQKLWGCSPFKHFDKMLITDRLAQAIEDLSDEGQQLHLIHILWKEFVLINGEKAGDERIEIAGEFMEFAVRRYKRVLFVFDLLDGTEIDVPGQEEDDDEPVF